MKEVILLSRKDRRAFLKNPHHHHSLLAAGEQQPILLIPAAVLQISGQGDSGLRSSLAARSANAEMCWDPGKRYFGTAKQETIAAQEDTNLRAMESHCKPIIMEVGECLIQLYTTH